MTYVLPTRSAGFIDSGPREVSNRRGYWPVANVFYQLPYHLLWYGMLGALSAAQTYKQPRSRAIGGQVRKSPSYPHMCTRVVVLPLPLSCLWGRTAAGVAWRPLECVLQCIALSLSLSVCVCARLPVRGLGVYAC